jgi:hypothetical protein
VVMCAFEGGGAQRDMVLLCNALLAKGVRLTILVLRNEGSLRSLLDPGIRVIPVSGQRLRYAIPGLRRAIRAIVPRLVVSSEAGLNLCSLVEVRLLPRADRPKLVLREVGSPSIAQRHDPHRQNRFAHRILRHFYRYADHIITLTEGARRDLAQNFSVPERMISVTRANAVIPPAMADRIAGWDGEKRSRAGSHRLRRTPVPREGSSHAPAGIDPAGTASPLAPGERGGETTAGCARDLRAPTWAHAARHLLRSADRFAWMMRAGVAVCASVYEGLCNEIIEALACGTPVVSTDCPYGPREILQDGRYGRLTPVDDAPAMASGIEAALDEVVGRGFLMAAKNAAAKFLEIVAELHTALTCWKMELSKHDV